MRKKIILYSVMTLLCLQCISVFPKFVYSADDFQAALDDKAVESISLRKDISGNFVCRRGNVTIEGTGFTLSAEDNEKPALFFDGPDLNRYSDILIRDLQFSAKESALHIQNFNRIGLKNLVFTDTETAILLDGCFNTSIQDCTFSSCDTCIELNSGARHQSGLIEIVGGLFQAFSVGIYDCSTADKEPGQDMVKIINSTIKGHPNFWGIFVMKANAHSVWNNPKDMVLSYRYFFKNLTYDKKIIPYLSGYYEKGNNNLAQEIEIILEQSEKTLESLSATIGKQQKAFYDTYEGFRVEKMEGIVEFLNDPKKTQLADFFEQIIQFSNELMFNSRFEAFFLDRPKDWDVDDGPVYQLFITKSMGWQYLAPVSLILSDEFQYLVDFAKQSKYCFVHDTPLSEWLQDLSETDSEFFKKSIFLYNALLFKEDYCLEVLDLLINHSDEMKTSVLPFKTEYQNYIDKYNDYYLTLLFDFPLQVIALGTIGEILQKQDQKEYLAELSQRFAKFYAIKNRFSKIETTARTYDKIQELFKQYLKKEDYNKFKDQINQTPLWLIQDMEGYITSVQ